MRLRRIGVVLLIVSVLLFLAVWWFSVDADGVSSSEDRFNLQFLVATAIVGYFPSEDGPRSAAWFAGAITGATTGIVAIAVGAWRARRERDGVPTGGASG